MTPADADVLGCRYTLLAVVGTGGMATVWRARDDVLGREVAIKVLSPQHATDPEFLARFEREARHAAAVSHPRLVSVGRRRRESPRGGEAPRARRATGSYPC